MTQIYWTRAQLLEGQIDRAARALEAADDSLFSDPALAEWIDNPLRQTSRQTSRRAMLRTILALEAARVVNARALKALRITPGAVKRWRDAIEAERRTSPAFREACADAAETIRERVQGVNAENRATTAGAQKVKAAAS